MKFNIVINGCEHLLEASGNAAYRLDEQTFTADVIAVAPGVYSVLVGSSSVTIRVEASRETGCTEGTYSLEINGRRHSVSIRDPRQRVRSGGTQDHVKGKQNIIASMPGKVVRVMVSEGQAVGSGQGLVVVEAMKMQNEIRCPKEGVVQGIRVREGQPVAAGEILLSVE